jgi:hypothetical protein
VSRYGVAFAFVTMCRELAVNDRRRVHRLISEVLQANSYMLRRQSNNNKNDLKTTCLIPCDSRNQSQKQNTVILYGPEKTKEPQPC